MLDLGRSGGFIGMAGMATTAFLYLYSPAVSPWWVAAPLIAVWVGTFALSCRWFVRRPVGAFWLPFGLLGLWVAVVVGGPAAGAWSL